MEIPYRPDSEKLFALVRDLPDAIWLDSASQSIQGRYDIISAAPDALIETRGGLSKITEQGARKPVTRTLLRWPSNCWNPYCRWSANPITPLSVV